MGTGIFEQCEIFGALTGEERSLIVEMGRESSAAAGERIIEEGSAGDGFYLLGSGRAEVLKGGSPIAELGPESLFGEMALFHDDVRTSEVRAVEPCRLLFIPKAAFIELVLQQEPAALRVMEKLGQLMVCRLQELDADLLELSTRDDPSSRAQLERFSVLRRPLMAQWALQYHAMGRPGKLAVVPSKPVGTAADLSVAYSPGVAEPCVLISRDPDRSYDYTSRGHLVGVISNGTRVLGLGNIGALASKPVMEGKAVLFKRFADLDSFDIEVDEDDPDQFIRIVCSLAPTFGGINLEDIQAPDCFYIEAECKRRMDIPVMHDDQHGTAIISGAGLLNALELVGKRIEAVRVVFSGSGAAGFAGAKYFLELGVRRENLIMTDIQGVVYRGRGDGNYLEELAAETDARTLAQALAGADVFVGFSAPNVLKPEMLRGMSRDPIVFALANPVPEIDYHLALETRRDAIIATGRSDYPNQINNVIAFPYIFRGALDTRSRAINEAMKRAATRAIAALAKEPISPDAGGELAGLRFGRDYLIPKPFDPRLLPRVSCAVAEAAMESGVARINLDLEDYRERLERLAERM
jgi:malate dehydrogenase (oxaloacetate-decarboxylating)(NADP+)